MNYPDLIAGFANKLLGISNSKTWDDIKAKNHATVDVFVTAQATITDGTSTSISFQKNLTHEFEFEVEYFELMDNTNHPSGMLSNGLQFNGIDYVDTVGFSITFRAP